MTEVRKSCCTFVLKHGMSPQSINMTIDTVFYIETALFIGFYIFLSLAFMTGDWSGNLAANAVEIVGGSPLLALAIFVACLPLRLVGRSTGAELIVWEIAVSSTLLLSMVEHGFPPVSRVAGVLYVGTSLAFLYRFVWFS